VVVTAAVLVGDVVGITTWVDQRQSYMSAGVPGIEATPDQRGWLGMKNRLRQQPAKVFSVSGPSRQRRRNS
jgi:hypothetical protein